MKLVIKVDSDRVVFYDVQDFQVEKDGRIRVWLPCYSPDEWVFDGDIVSCCDSTCIPEDDKVYEKTIANEIIDGRILMKDTIESMLGKYLWAEKDR